MDAAQHGAEPRSGHPSQPDFCLALALVRGGCIASDTDCYYRCTLPVADNVASIEMTCYFDDTGEIYLNGARLVKDGSFEQRVFPMKAQNFKVTSEKLKPVNTLAIHVFNGRYYGGLFLLGKKHLKDGGVEYFHSAPFPEEGVDPGVHERD